MRRVALQRAHPDAAPPGYPPAGPGAARASPAAALPGHVGDHRSLPHPRRNVRPPGDHGTRQVNRERKVTTSV